MRTVAAIVATAAVLIVLIVVNAPPPDDADHKDAGPAVPIRTVFTILEAEHDVAREIWANDIVRIGQERGLRFDKDWLDAGLDAGPLPALFLRDLAENMRRTRVPLYLFLGSDRPINDANLFFGPQMDHFAELKRTGRPRFFTDPELGFHTAMFSDVAVTDACVECHNEDPDSPKNDWRVGDIMGAATWSYPEEEVGAAEALMLLGTLRHGLREAYQHYLDKVATFADPPPVGDRWPADGYYLPSVEAFLSRVEQRASANTVSLLLRAQDGNRQTETGQDLDGHGETGP